MKPYFDDGKGRVIYHGDCFEILHELDGLGGVVTDPPYSSGGAFRGDRAQKTTTKYVQSELATFRSEFSGDTRDQRSFFAWCTLWLSAARNACVPSAPLVSFIDWRQLPVLTDAVQGGGWVWRNLGTWWKPGVRMQKGRFSSSAEYIIYASNGECAEGRCSPQNVYSSPVVTGDEKQHIAEKPLEVLLWAMGVIPETPNPILDPFMGSGTTLRAAKDLGLKAIGIELEEKYCEIAARRLEQEVFDFSAQ